jgi:hypothetical protein
MVDQVAVFGQAMREARAAGEPFEVAWTTALRRCTQREDLHLAGHAHPPAGASAMDRAKQAQCANPRLSARAAAREAGVSVGTAIEARRRPLASGWVPHRVPPDDSTARALRATEEAWRRAWAGEPPTRNELAAVALLAVLSEPEPAGERWRLVA